MGISLNVETNNENEFNQQLQMYLAQGYSMQSNFNGTAILKKKSYSMGVLIVLILLFFPGAVLYYLLASDDVVTIRNKNGQQTNTNTANTNIGVNNQSFDSYCEECGHGLYKDSKFCPRCGKEVNETEDNPIDESPKENEIIEQEKTEVVKCTACGTEISEEDKFCPKCGELIIKTDDE